MNSPASLPSAALSAPVSDAEIFGIERPHPKLWKYYFLCCLLGGPLFPILLVPNWFRYHTMRYRFDAEGISMRWGILFRREVLLNYARIQDIHLVSNFVERWLGLARIQIQTASGSASPEMTLEGLVQFEGVRDFLYGRMRGMAVKAGNAGPPPLAGGSSEIRSGAGPCLEGSEAREVAETLRVVAGELRAIREILEKGGNR
jgi:uncharacterized protein